jgi:hypothetical protein
LLLLLLLLLLFFNPVVRLCVCVSGVRACVRVCVCVRARVCVCVCLFLSDRNKTKIPSHVHFMPFSLKVSPSSFIPCLCGSRLRILCVVLCPPPSPTWRFATRDATIFILCPGLFCVQHVYGCVAVVYGCGCLESKGEERHVVSECAHSSARVCRIMLTLSHYISLGELR